MTERERTAGGHRTGDADAAPFAGVVLDVDAALAHHASRTPDAPAIIDPERRVSYAVLDAEITRAARTLESLGVRAGERVAVVATKRVGTVVALLGTMRLGAIGVPINPSLKADQVVHILADSGARTLVASPIASGELPSERLAVDCPALREVLTPIELIGSGESPRTAADSPTLIAASCHPGKPDAASPAMILYTSGSTARPKGVMLSRSNLAHGAASVATYLGNVPEDRLLALMPLSFDYGLNQVLTALRVGAEAVLFDYLLPKGVVTAVVRHRITGLPAVPHIWNQLARLDWPPVEHLRYVTSTGGRMPVETTRALARRLPTTDIVLMYGFTEAFRSTRLPPAEVARRPDSIGIAVPHAEVLVVDPRGRECRPNETGELIHGGPLVALGYWNDELATRAKFRPRFEAREHRGERPTRFAWSGDLARRDEEGYLYFVSRREGLAKLHGFRVNPLEIEEAIARSPRVRDVGVVCVPHPLLEQAAVAIVVADAADLDEVNRHCRRCLPRFMRPERIVTAARLPTGPNSKVDYAALRERYDDLFAGLDA